MQKAQPFIAATALAAVVAATAAALLLPSGDVDATTLGILVGLTAALVAASSLPIRLRSDAGHLLTLEEAVLLAMLVTVPLGFVPWLVMLGTTLNEVRRRNPLPKLAFNAGAAGLGASLAVMEMRLLESVAQQGLLQSLGVAAFGVAVAATAQLLLIAVLFSRLGRGPVREHLSLDGYLDLAIALNLVLGAVLAAAIVADPWLVVLDVLLVLVVGLVLRGGVEPSADLAPAAD